MMLNHYIYSSINHKYYGRLIDITNVTWHIQPVCMLFFGIGYFWSGFLFLVFFFNFDFFRLFGESQFVYQLFHLFPCYRFEQDEVHSTVQSFFRENLFRVARYRKNHRLNDVLIIQILSNLNRSIISIEDGHITIHQDQ